MATKKKTTTKKRTAKKATAAKKPATPKKAAIAKPRRTFAVRITDQELKALHAAAGPRNASRFARTVLAAFANGDSKAFARVLEETAKARS